MTPVLDTSSPDDARRIALRRAALRRARMHQAVARRSVLLLGAGTPWTAPR
jgi:hypothetical protein